MNYFNYMNLQDCFKQYNIVCPDENSFLRWYKDIGNTKVAMFSYEDLPTDNGITTEIIETALMFRNNLAFTKITGLGLVLGYYTYGGVFDLYWKPTTVDFYALNGKYLGQVEYSALILARDNQTDIIPFLTLSGWINKIITLEKTLDILTILIRLPTLFTGDKAQAAQLKTLFKKTLDFEGFVFGDKSLKDTVEQFDIHLPATLDEVYQQMEKYKNYALNSIGIYSVNEKRERIVTSEIQAQNDYADFVYQGMLNQRQQFVNLLNSTYGYNIKLVESYKQSKQDEVELAHDLAVAQDVTSPETDKKSSTDQPKEDK